KVDDDPDIGPEIGVDVEVDFIVQATTTVERVVASETHEEIVAAVADEPVIEHRADDVFYIEDGVDTAPAIADSTSPEVGIDSVHAAVFTVPEVVDDVRFATPVKGVGAAETRHEFDGV